MKRFSTSIVLLLTSFAVSSVSHAQDEFPILEGPYLGQKLPGSTAEPFAPGIVNTEEWGILVVFPWI